MNRICARRLWGIAAAPLVIVALSAQQSPPAANPQARPVRAVRSTRSCNQLRTPRVPLPVGPMILRNRRTAEDPGRRADEGADAPVGPCVPARRRPAGDRAARAAAS